MEPLPHFPLVAAGDYEDHAILLCSLLLGFGLDAYVCVGTVQDQGAGGTIRDHVWVITRSRRNGSMNRPRVVFWEALTGQRYRTNFSPHAV